MTSSASVDYVNPPFLKLNYIKNTSGGLKIAPIGSIVMIDYATPPDGWAVCNGENGTVNLVNRFAYGIDPPGEDLLVSGGRETHTHPAKTTGSAGEHNHTLGVTINQSAGSGTITEVTGGVESAPAPHTHNAISLTLDTQAAHAHTYPETNPANHLPPYVYLYYIQRIT